MLLTWRWTVFSARCRAVAMAWLVSPAATSRSTSSSRPVRRALPAGGAGGGGVRVGGRLEVGGGAQPVEDRPGGVQFHGRGVLVAQLPAGQADQQPGPGALRRRLHLRTGPAR